MSILTEQQAQLAMVATRMRENDGSPPVMLTAQQAALRANRLVRRRLAKIVQEASQKGHYHVRIRVGSDKDTAAAVEAILEAAGYATYPSYANNVHEITFKWSRTALLPRHFTITMLHLVTAAMTTTVMFTIWSAHCDAQQGTMQNEFKQMQNEGRRIAAAHRDGIRQAQTLQDKVAGIGWFRENSSVLGVVAITGFLGGVVTIGSLRVPKPATFQERVLSLVRRQLFN